MNFHSLSLLSHFHWCYHFWTLCRPNPENPGLQICLHKESNSSGQQHAPQRENLAPFKQLCISFIFWTSFGSPKILSSLSYCSTVYFLCPGQTYYQEKVLSKNWYECFRVFIVVGWLVVLLLLFLRNQKRYLARILPQPEPQPTKRLIHLVAWKVL